VTRLTAINNTKMASQDTKTTDTKPATGTLSKITNKAKEYSKFWADHVKKGEAPWTQWYCCGLVNGKVSDILLATWNIN
jgi:hypothetical protein